MVRGAMRHAAATDPLARGLRSLLVGGTLGTAALQVAARALGFAATLVLAALMGASGYGAYAWVVAWMAVLAVPATLGRDRLLVREVAAHAARREWALLRGVLVDSRRRVVVCALLVACGGLVVALVAGALVSSPLVDALPVGFVLLPLLALVALAQGALQGLHRVVAALAPDAVVRPVVFLALVGGAAAASGGGVTPAAAIAFQAIAMAAALAVTVRVLTVRLPRAVASAQPEYSRGWMRSGLTMAAGSALTMLHGRVDLILVGVFLGATDAGAYGVAVAAASIAALPFMAIVRPLSPLVARLHALGDEERLARAVTSATRVATAATLVVGLALALGGELGLGLLGHAFTHATSALALLCAAALVNAAFAANLLVLVMCGHEGDATRATAVGAASAVVLNAALIPLAGLTGAGAATALSVLVRNAAASYYTRTRLGIDTTLLGRPAVR